MNEAEIKNNYKNLGGAVIAILGEHGGLAFDGENWFFEPAQEILISLRLRTE